MRKILFRGKSKKNNKWCYGSLLYDGWKHKYCIVNDLLNATEVYAKSIGQLTGVKDENGNKIFEGDIVSDTSYDEACGEIEWNNEELKFIVRFDNVTYDFECYEGRDLHVEGNVYDNPELLL